MIDENKSFSYSTQMGFLPNLSHQLNKSLKKSHTTGLEYGNTIRVRLLFECGYYLGAAFIRVRLLFECGNYSSFFCKVFFSVFF